MSENGLDARPPRSDDRGILEVCRREERRRQRRRRAIIAQFKSKSTRNERGERWVPGVPGTGFSLVEVLISMAILTFGLLALFMLHNTALSGNSLAGRISTCAVLAQDLMEELQGMDYQYGDSTPTELQDIGDDPTSDADPLVALSHPNNGADPDPINSLGSTDSTQGPLTYYRTWDISYPDPSDTNLMQIKVRVTFKDKMTGRNHGVTVTSFRMVDPADSY